MVVLPTDPVIPTTPPTRPRASTPRSMSATDVSATLMAVPPSGACMVR